MRKKILSVAVVLCMMVSLMPSVKISAKAELTPATEFAYGDGLTADTAFEINTAEQLALMADKVNNHNSDLVKDDEVITYGNAFYKLTSDITLGYWHDDNSNGVEDNGEIYDSESFKTAYTESNWTPIGIDDEHIFKGNFDGDGHTISGIYINESEAIYQGLFGSAKDGTIKNVSVSSSYIQGKTFVGSILGICENTKIQNCSNSGSVVGAMNIGGISGNCCDATIQYCYNTGNVSGSGSYSHNIGGISSSTYNGTIQYCYNTGSVCGDQNIGGIVGRHSRDYLYNSVVQFCYNAGNVNGRQNIGGVSGYCASGDIQFCYNTGNVSGSTDLGSIVGLNKGNVRNCYYDKQMCPVCGINGSDVIGEAEGKLIAEMVGKGLRDETAWGDNNWVFEVGMYPRIKDMDTTDAAYVSANPIILTDEETVSSVSKNFEVGENHGIKWDPNNTEIISISDGHATVTRQSSISTVVLTASKNNTSRTVEMQIAEVPKYSVREAETKVIVNGVTAAMGSFDSSPYATGSTVTATITLSGNATEAGTHTVGLTSTKAGEITAPETVTKTVAAGDSLSDTFNFTFTMPSEAVDDLVVTHTFKEQDDGGSYIPYYPPLNGADVIINGNRETAGNISNTTVNGKHKKAVTINDNKIKKLLENKENGTSVIIPITGNTNIASGVLTGQIIKNMEAKEATLEIMTDSATYTLPASAIDIDSVSEQFGEDVALGDIDVEISIAEPSDDTVTVVEDVAEDGNFALVVPAVDFTITCTHNGQTKSVSSFNSYVERTVEIPYSVDHTKITTGIVVNANGTIHHVPTRVVEIDGKWYAVINSLTNSTYSVIWHPIEFMDIENHWAKDVINDMGSRMVVNGIGENNYDPERSVTRAEFAAIIVRALGLGDDTGKSNFADVNETDWFCGYVKTAADYGIINGYGNGFFGPNDKITREQAMVILDRAMNLAGLNMNLTSDDVNSLLAKYTDSSYASDYAKGGIAACIKIGVITGTSCNTLSPTNYVTRAEVAVMAQRLLKECGLI